jgi:hypothetical protein
MLFSKKVPAVEEAAPGVGNLRFGPGKTGITPAYGGIPYKVPNTPNLKQLINPQGGLENCRACAVAVDKLMAGESISVAPGALKAGSAAPIEKLYGKRFKSASLSSVVREVRNGGSGSRGIVYGTHPGSIRPDGSVGQPQAHVFNVVNIEGDVMFLDGQSGLADLEYWKIGGLLRTE